MGILQAVFLFLRALLLRRAAAAVENLALRQQVAVSNQSVKRPKLRPRDRVFWVLLSRCWPNWRSALAIVQPDTVIKWHRMGFRLYWGWKSRPGKPGRPPVERKIRDLIRRMSRENPTWGAPRIVSELALLGHDVAKERWPSTCTGQGCLDSAGWRLAPSVHTASCVTLLWTSTVPFLATSMHQRKEPTSFCLVRPAAMLLHHGWLLLVPSSFAGRLPIPF